MNGPGDDVRNEVFRRAESVKSEEEFEARVLAYIEQQLQREDPDSSSAEDEDDSDELLGAVESWLSLVSQASLMFYAPASPWPRSVAGWGQKAVGRIRRISRLLLAPLRAGAMAVNATSWSIAVGFPGGPQVQLTWS